jgi:TetR/AcrR family transcriptional repressor of lmrAB and yxaGH operons
MSLTVRERMVRSAAVLMREHGIEGMSFAAVLEHSGAPRGSIYHHFPGGKAQLVEEATRWAGEFIAQRNARALEVGGPAGMLETAQRFWRDVFGETNYRAGCPIAAATLEGDRVPAARAAAGVAFNRWQEIFAAAMTSRGVSLTRASSVATLVFAGIEGGVILARAQQSIDPLERVLDELRRLVQTELDAARP